MSEVATIQVQVSWDIDADCEIGAFGNTAYDDITADVKSISTRRGKSSDMGQMQQSSCTIRLHDTTGKYNPENASSPLAGHLIPIRPLKIEATYGGTTYPLYFGNVTRIEHDPGAQESTIEAADMSVFLNLYKPFIDDLNGGIPFVNQAVGYLIEVMIEWLGYPAAWHDCDSGHVIPSFAPDGSANMLSVFSDLLEVDLGMIYISRDGKLTYRDTTSLYLNQTTVATFTGDMVTGLRSTIAADTIVNDQSVTKTGGVLCIAHDGSSQLRYGMRTGSPITSPYLVDDTQAQNLADLIVAMKTAPQSPARQITLVNADATRLTQMLERELGDLVAVSETRGGTSFTGLVAGIEHEITSGGQVHRTTFAVQKRTLAYFIVGTSTVGSQIGSGAIY